MPTFQFDGDDLVVNEDAMAAAALYALHVMAQPEARMHAERQEIFAGVRGCREDDKSGRALYRECGVYTYRKGDHRVLLEAGHVDPEKGGSLPLLPLTAQALRVIARMLRHDVEHRERMGMEVAPAVIDALEALDSGASDIVDDSVSA